MMKTRRAAGGLWGALLILLWVGCTRTEEPPAPEVAPRTTDLVAEALRSVVLVVADREGGVGYGAAFVVAPTGELLTNAHVVQGARRLRVMPYRTGRLSYIPMEGGLDRFLFENEQELLEARVVRLDPALDLAVIEARGAPRLGPGLTLAPEDPPVQPGDRVFALGHPGETVWSFTAGVVSGLHRAAIQHDAAINGGSSGGPLLDVSGRVVGINTSKLLAGSEGVAFARPATAGRRMVDTLTGGYSIDFSDLRAAVLGCFHAQELGAPVMRDCFDTESWWRHHVSGIQALARELGIPAEVLAPLTAPDQREQWIRQDLHYEQAFANATTDAERDQLKAQKLCEISERLAPLRPFLEPQTVARAFAEAKADKEAQKRRLFERQQQETGLLPELGVEAPLQATLRMGIRIESVDQIGPEEAWILLRGRNLDLSPYRLSEHWVRRDQRWYQELSPEAAALKTLPEGWPLPLGDEASMRAMVRAGILESLDHLASSHGEFACGPDLVQVTQG